jgi:biopolymer transport protein ExbD
MTFKKRRELPRTRIEIIPMIDTIFFLLVFFMLSSLSLTRLRGLPVDLPDAKTSTAQQTSDLTLTIDAGGRLFLEKVPVAWPDLQRALLANALAKVGATSGGSRGGSRGGSSGANGASADLSRVSLVLNADRRVPHGQVIRAIDTARDIGITRYGIATSASSAAPPR